MGCRKKFEEVEEHTIDHKTYV